MAMSAKYTGVEKKVATYILLSILLVVAGAGVYVIFGRMPDADRAKLLLEIGKFLLQIIALVVIAGLATTLIRSFEKNRKADKALHDFRSGILTEVQAVYQTIKKSRHALRSAGLIQGNLVTMNNEVIQIYEVEVGNVLDSSLSLERVKLEIDRFPDSFSRFSDLKTTLVDMYGYLDGLLLEYETVHPNLKVNATLAQFTKVTDFTSADSQSNYTKTFFGSYEKAVGYVKQDLLPLKAVTQAATLTGSSPVGELKS
jgi:hypothetical protein